MATVDDLSVRVSASTADFTSGMNMAERALSGLRSDALQTAGVMQVLQGRIDEAGDEAQTAGMQAGASSAGFTSLAASAASTEVSFSSLSLVTATALIPSLLTLSTIVAPLTAALGGFITVAAAITGVGLVGFLGAAVTNSERLKTTFNQLAATIQTQFAPAFNIFAGVLDRLMQSLTAIIPQLVPAEKVVRKIATQFEALGQAIIGVLPAFTRLAVQLTQKFLPPFVEWAERVLPRIPGLLRSLIPVMQQVGASLQPFVRAFLDMLPAMTEFGITVLNVIVPALTRFTRLFDSAMRAVNGLDRETAALVTTVTILGPVIAGIATTLGGLSAPILGVVAALGALGTAFATNFGGIRTTVLQTARAIQRFVGSLRLGQIVRAVGVVKNLRGAFRQLRGVASMFVTGIQPAINRFVTTLKQNRPAIRGFFREITQNVNGLVDVFRNVFLPSIRFVLQNATIPIINRFSKIFAQVFGTVLRTATQAINRVQRVFRSLGRVVMSAVTTVQNTLRPLVSWLRSAFGSQIRIVFREAGRTLQVWANTVQRVIVGVRNALQPFVSWLRSGFATAIRGALNLIRAAWQRWGNEITAVVRFAFSTIRGVIETSMNAIRTGIVAVLRVLRGDFRGAWDAIAGFVRSTLSGLQSYVSTWGSRLRGAINSAMSAAQAAITNGFNAAIQAGRNVLSGFVSWVSGSWGVVSAFRSALTSAKNAALAPVRSLRNTVERWMDALLGRIESVMDRAQAARDAVPDASDIPDVPDVNVPDAPNVNVPGLDTGGYIESGGLAQLHAGERVMTAAEVDRTDGGSGDGGTTINVGKIEASSYEEGRQAMRGLNDELDSHGV